MQIGPHATLAHSCESLTPAQPPLPPTPTIWPPVWSWTLLLHHNRHPALTFPPISTSLANDHFASFSRSLGTNSWKYGPRRHRSSPISLVQDTFTLRSEPSSLAAILIFELMPTSIKQRVVCYHGSSATHRRILSSFLPPCTNCHTHSNPLLPQETYLPLPIVNR